MNTLCICCCQKARFSRLPAASGHPLAFAHRTDADPYQRFFSKLAKGRPTFKKTGKYTSFTFPQSGHKLDGNTVTIDGVKYKFVKHRRGQHR